MSGMMWTEEERKRGGNWRGWMSVEDGKNVGGANGRVSVGMAEGKHAELEMRASLRMERAVEE